MTSIVLDEQQSKAISTAKGSIELRDPQGNRLGFVTPAINYGFTDEDIELAKKSLASDSRRYTTQEVLEHLRQLSEGQ